MGDPGHFEKNSKKGVAEFDNWRRVNYLAIVGIFATNARQTFFSTFSKMVSAPWVTLDILKKKKNSKKNVAEFDNWRRVNYLAIVGIFASNARQKCFSTFSKMVSAPWVTLDILKKTEKRM